MQQRRRAALLALAQAARDSAAEGAAAALGRLADAVHDAGAAGAPCVLEAAWWRRGVRRHVRFDVKPSDAPPTAASGAAPNDGRAGDGAVGAPRDAAVDAGAAAAGEATALSSHGAHHSAAGDCDGDGEAEAGRPTAKKANDASKDPGGAASSEALDGGGGGAVGETAEGSAPRSEVAARIRSAASSDGAIDHGEAADAVVAGADSQEVIDALRGAADDDLSEALRCVAAECWDAACCSRARAAGSCCSTQGPLIGASASCCARRCWSGCAARPTPARRFSRWLPLWRLCSLRCVRLAAMHRRGSPSHPLQQAVAECVVVPLLCSWTDADSTEPRTASKPQLAVCC